MAKQKELKAKAQDQLKKSSGNKSVFVDSKKENCCKCFNFCNLCSCLRFDVISAPVGVLKLVELVKNK